jgi:arylsulfatase B
MQHYVIISDEPWGLPLKEKVLPEYFKEAGYKTALIGKWHLGFHEKIYTPTFRGFDFHYGYLGPYIGYYDHSLIMLDKNYSRGHDFRRNLEMAMDVKGKYATEIFTNEAVNLIHNHDVDEPLFLLLTHLAPHTGNEDQPMEAPADVLEKFDYIRDKKRRTLAGMISVMDEGVGKVVEAIKEKGILENTIIMFLSGACYDFEKYLSLNNLIMQIMVDRREAFIQQKPQIIPYEVKKVAFGKEDVVFQLAFIVP